MFKLAAALVQRQVGVIALIAISLLIFTRDHDIIESQSASAWSHQTVAVATPG